MRILIVLLFLFLVPSATFAQENHDILVLDNEDENTRLRMERHHKRVQEERQVRLLVSFLSRLGENDGLIGTLELVEGQKNEIRTIQDQFRKEEAALELPNDATEMDEERYNLRQQNLKAKFAKKIRECLLEGQVEAIFSSRISDKGIPKVLVESPIGDVLRLTDAQKKRIANSSDEISKKIGAFQLEIRKEACKAVFDELTPEQRKQFLKVYDVETLTSYFHQRSMGLLSNDYFFKPYKEVPQVFELESVFPEFKKPKD